MKHIFRLRLAMHLLRILGFRPNIYVKYSRYTKSTASASNTDQLIRLIDDHSGNKEKLFMVVEYNIPFIGSKPGYPVSPTDLVAKVGEQAQENTQTRAIYE